MSGLLDHSPADITRYQLIAGSQGTLPTNNSTWPIFVGNEPDTPDDCITVYDVTGEAEGITQIDGEVQERYSIQIRVRSAIHTTNYIKCQSIQNYLDKSIKRTTLTISSSDYLIHDYIRRQPILRLGKDTPNSKRELFVLNYLLKVDKT